MIVENAYDGIFVARNQIIIYCNIRATEITGFKRKQLMGMSFKEIVHPDEYEKVIKRHRERLEGKDVIPKYETIIIHKNSKNIPIELTATNVDWDGDIADLIIIRDISTRKQTEKKLAEQKRRLEDILKGTNVGTWEWNVQTGETVYNERWADIIGYTLEEISPVSIKTGEKFTHPDDLIERNRLLEKHFKGELDYYECEYRMRHKNGTWVWVLDRGKVSTWRNDGEPLFMYGTHQDITKRKQYKENLKESEKKFRTLAQTTACGILLYQNDKWVYANPSAEKISGYSLEELKKMNFWEIVAPEFKKKVKKRGQKRQKNIETISGYEFKIISKQGQEKWIHLEGATTEYNGEPAGLISVMDITALKKAEEKLTLMFKKTKEALRKSEFYRDLISHDMGNILTTIISSTELLELLGANPDKSEEYKKYLENMVQEAKRGANLISTVRALSNIEEEKRQTSVIDIKKIVNRAIQYINFQIQNKKIDIQTKLPEELMRVNAGDLLQDAMNKILLNSCVHNKNERIQIWIELSKVHNEVQNFIKIEIKDNGIGVSDERKNKMFEKIIQKGTSKVGSASSLLIVYEIIKIYGGKIWIENRVEGDYKKGSNFIILLRETQE